VDIRTKLVFALVSVALGSMAVLGLIMYGGVERELRDQTMEQLEGLAQFKLEALEGILAGWHDRVALVASPTELRRSLDELGRAGSPEAAAVISTILEDALDASPLFQQLWVHDADGTPIVRAGAEGGAVPIGADLLDDPSAGTRYGGVAFGPTGEPTVSFTAVLGIDDRRVGFLRAVLVIDEIVALSTNYEGLEETGETMVVARDPDGAPRVLHPVRFADGGHVEDASNQMLPGFPNGSGLLVDGDGAAVLALDGEEASFAGELTDYRGEDVWAATRFLPETDWGVVVKIDADEQVQPIADFRRDTARLAVTLAAFAILLGTIIGFQVAKPILYLADVAARIQDGDLTARTGLAREDEVGLLAKTFDEMAESLEEKVELLTEYRTFFNVSLDMLCIASIDGYFKRINDAFVRELGWPKTELLGRPFVSLIHPDDVQATSDEIAKLAGGLPTIHFENRFRCKDGSYKRLRWTTYPDAASGRLYAIARVLGPESEGTA
jgi:PAS domain S-box-containing protein